MSAAARRRTIECRVVALVPVKQHAAGVLGQNRAAVKRVDDQILGIREILAGGTPQEEVTRKIDAFDLETGAARDLHVQHAQRNRDAGTPLEDFVQEAVARVLIVAGVAAELELVEKEVVQRQHLRVTLRIDARRRVGFGRDRRCSEAKAGFAAKRVELIEIRADVERRIFDSRDQQRRHRHVLVGAQCGVRESVNE